jgi:hypothetical protein
MKNEKRILASLNCSIQGIDPLKGVNVFKSQLQKPIEIKFILDTVLQNGSPFLSVMRAALINHKFSFGVGENTRAFSIFNPTETKYSLPH